MIDPTMDGVIYGLEIYYFEQTRLYLAPQIANLHYLFAAIALS